MVKKITISCDFQTGKSPVDFFVCKPADGCHPIQYQSKWLSEAKGGQVPHEILDAITKLQKISKEQKIPLEDLCEYAFKMAHDQNSSEKEGETGSQAE